MKRIIFLNRFFFPDHSATSQILSDLAFHLAGKGRDVHVITSRQKYDDPNAELPYLEKVHGVTVHRVASSRFGRAGLVGRGFDYLTFYRSMMRTLRGLAGRGDVIVAKTDPPLLSIPAARIARRSGAQLITWLQDIYPEVAAELGVPLVKGAIGNAIATMRDRSLKAAAANVVVGERMRGLLVARGIASDKISLIPNWCDDRELVPVPHEENPLRAEWGLQDKFVVGYSGNLGRAHEFDTVLQAAKQLKGRRDIVFLMIGGGHQVAELAELVKRERIEDLFYFVPYQPRERLKYSLGVADVHWISLQPRLEGLIVPSKVYGIAAAGRPIIAITAKDGEIARMINGFGCGIVVEPGAAGELVAALDRLSRDRRVTDFMGHRARAAVEAEFARDHAFARWDGLLDRLAS